MRPHPAPPLGYSEIPPGCLATVVTCLEMHARPARRGAADLPAPFRLVPFARGDLAAYRAVYRKVGEDWMWFSRLIMPDAELKAILEDPAVEAFAVNDGHADVGILELDFREAGQCELAFFGLAREAIGHGLGRALMDAALARAWAKPIDRLWVHTCTFDHPSALGFYVRSSFVPYATMVEVQTDPRLTGHLPRSAAPQIPLIDPHAEH
jgi:GNAT superfamily N-acetyltransferase